MFDVGFSELVVIAIVALVVIGPERLPKVARTAGHLLGRLQRYVNDVKADINREMQLDELKKLQSDLQQSATNFEQSVNSEIQTVQQLVNQTVARDELTQLQIELQATASNLEQSINSEIQTIEPVAEPTVEPVEDAAIPAPPAPADAASVAAAPVASEHKA